MRSIKRRLTVVVLALSMMLPVLGATAAPAHAADNAWSVSACRSDILWYGIPGVGAWYYWYGDGNYHWLSGGWHAAYASAGYECGRLGAPIGGVTVLSGDGTRSWSGIAVDGMRIGVTPDHIHFQGGCIVGNVAFKVDVPCPYN